MACRTTPSLSPLVSFFSILFLAAASHGRGQDTLSQGKSLQDGQTLVSLGRVFELGFFTPPGANSSLRYVGIRYYGLPSSPVVWVANRNDPVLGSSGKITVSRDGNLEVLDGGGTRRWWTNESTPAVAGGNSTVLHLVDTGNLFLNVSEGGAVRWQSFEHPTDTFLPGMRVTLDKATGKGTRLRSWRSELDPAEGDYSLGLDPAGSPQVFLWRGTSPLWRSGQVVGGMFTGVRLRSLGSYGWNVEHQAGDAQGSMTLTYSHYNSSLFRFAVRSDGRVGTLLLGNKTTGEWGTVVLLPAGDCDRYGHCGNNSVCVASGDAGACECLRGFQPRVETEWKAGNWSGGCVRTTPVRCETNATVAGEEDGFWVMKGVKPPDLARWRVANEGECEGSCRGICSCTAYAYTADLGCLTWSAALVDVEQFPDGGIDLHLKLAGSELANKNKGWIVLLITALLVVVVFLLGSYLWWKCRAKIRDWWKKSRNSEILLLNRGHGSAVPPEFVDPTQLVDQTKDGKCSELPFFSFESIAAATENFSKSNKLGQGGFGHVYKGILPDGREIAVKRLSEASGQGLEEFKNEVILIAKLQHRNLVRMMGYCIQEAEKILIYEYLPNKSLDSFIFNPSMKPILDWRKRFNIIEGIARGLLYLHRDSRLRIIHRDLKASNILLDEEMNPKISDFGMARIFGGNQNQLNTNRVVGTYGYMSPEYAMEGLFSIKSDVYSFGVLALEIISGQRNNSFHRAANSPNLVGHAWKLWNEDRWLELVDPSIRSSVSMREVMRCIQVGLLCVQDRAIDRPTISTVLFMLRNEATAHPMPKQPTFTLEGSPTETELLAPEGAFSTNGDVTITVVGGR